MWFNCNSKTSEAVKMYILWHKTYICKLWHEVIAGTLLYFDDGSKQYTRQLRGILLHCFIPRVNAHQSFWLSQREKKEQGNGNISNYYLQKLIYQSMVSCPWTEDCSRAKWLLFLAVPLEMHSSYHRPVLILWLMSTGITEMCLVPAPAWPRGSWWKTQSEIKVKNRGFWLWRQKIKTERWCGGWNREWLPPSLV